MRQPASFPPHHVQRIPDAPRVFRFRLDHPELTPTSGSRSYPPHCRWLTCWVSLPTGPYNPYSALGMTATCVIVYMTRALGGRRRGRNHFFSSFPTAAFPAVARPYTTPCPTYTNMSYLDTLTVRGLNSPIRSLGMWRLSAGQAGCWDTQPTQYIVLKMRGCEKSKA